MTYALIVVLVIISVIPMADGEYLVGIYVMLTAILTAITGRGLD